MSELLESEQLQDADGEDGRPDALPENFKTVEDLVESYRQAQGELTRKSQALAETQQALDAVLEARQFELPDYEAPPVPVAVASRQPVDYLTLLGTLANEAARAAVRALPPIGSVSPAAVAHQSAVDELIARDPELQAASWDRLAPLVAERVERDPSLLPDRALESPAATVKARKAVARDVRVDQVRDLGRINQQLSEQATLQMKLRAQVTTGTGGRPDISDEDDAAFAESLLAAHTGTYAQKMAARGL